MDFTLRRYRVTVQFKNDGSIYGTEKYLVLANNEDQAERKALTNATASNYDDDRIPDRRVYVSDVEEVDMDEQEDLAA